VKCEALDIEKRRDGEEKMMLLLNANCKHTESDVHDFMLIICP
jgi:hypothetical protein